MEDGVKVMPVGQLMLLVKENTPVGIEVVWDRNVRQAADGCAVLNILKVAGNDAAWVVRQVHRTADNIEEEEDTVQ